MRRSLGLAFHTMCAVAALSAGAMQAQAAPAATAPQSIIADSDSGDDYAWIDKADSLWEAIGNAPPDRSFAFEGGEPWAWETRDGYRILVEDNGDGIRSFYFEPGEDAPFLAVTPAASFGFADGGLAMVYGAGGDALRPADRAGYDREARALYERGERMLAAMLGGEAQPVDSGAWIDTAPLIQVFLTAWDEARVRHPGWRRHHASDENARALRRRLEAERLRRMAIARRFERWRAGGFEGTPSGRWRKPDSRPDHPRRQGRAGEWHRPGESGWQRGVDQGPGSGAGGRGDGMPRPRRFENPATTPTTAGAGSVEGGRPRRWGDGARPDRPNGERRWQRPQAPAAPAAAVSASSDAVPTADAPPVRGTRGGDRPRWNRPVPAPTPAATSSGGEASTVSPPARPRWNRGEDGGARWNRPAPAPAPSGVTTPSSVDASTVSPPARPRWNRSDDGGARWNRPNPGLSDSGAAPQRPRWNQPEGGNVPSSRPAPAPSQPVVTQRSYTPPPAPAYTAPAQREAPSAPRYNPPPAPRAQPSYSRPSKREQPTGAVTDE